MLCRMSTKAIFGIIVVLIIIGAGAYFYMNPSSLGLGGDTATTTEQGDQTTPQVQGQDTVVGEGPEATPGKLVSVLYTGRFQDGTVFDSSEAHDNQPLTFILGTEGLIPGFQIGVNGMKEGGSRLIAVPPELGYGANDVKDAEGNVVIPANSTLIFEVKLVKVEDAPAGSAPATGTESATE